MYPEKLIKYDVTEWKKEFDMSMYGTDARIKSTKALALLKIRDLQNLPRGQDDFHQKSNSGFHRSLYSG